jgi:y4mF family transcriptional regulator
MLVKTLGETIKKRRKELSITQPHLAELANVSTNTLYKLERGQGNPSLDVLNKLAEVLGMDLTLKVKSERPKVMESIQKN